MSVAAATVSQEADDDTLSQKHWEIYQIMLQEDYCQLTILYTKVPDYIASHFPVRILDY